MKYGVFCAVVTVNEGREWDRGGFEVRPCQHTPGVEGPKRQQERGGSVELDDDWTKK